MPHAGHDSSPSSDDPSAQNFNSRAPCGARLFSRACACCSSVFQLTCPMRGTTFVAIRDTIDPKDFNSRAPCGARPPLPCSNRTRIHFNSRAPCGARRQACRSPRSSFLFQLTCPMRGTTVPVPHRILELLISTHVPRAGHDGVVDGKDVKSMNFNSRAPCGARLRGRSLFCCPR